MSPSFRLLAATLFAASLAFAQTPAAQPQAAPPKDPEYVSTHDFRTKLFIVKHRSPMWLRNILRPLTSGFKGVAFDATDQDGLKTLSVRDFPENLAAIEEALVRLDVPAPARKEVELHIHVLYASKQDAPGEPLPAELQEVIQTLKGTLNYRSYQQAITFVQRTADGTDNLRGRGQGEGEKPARNAAPGPEIRFDWQIKALGVETSEAGPAVLSLRGFSLEAQESGGRSLAYVVTDLSLKDGEKVVVGTSAFKDKALIVVVTAKML